MKNLVVLFFAFLLFSCATSVENDEVDEAVRDTSDRIVKMVFFTNEPNYDEVHVNYYDYKTDGFIAGVYAFEYNSAGEALPLEIILENYDFRYVNGDAYRNNHSSALLAVEIYVDGELVDQDSDTGDSQTYAVVKWNYDAGF